MSFANPHNINYAADGSAVTTHTNLGVMTGVAAGDRALAFISHGLYATSLPTLSSFPSGWNEITKFGESGLRCACHIWEKQGLTGTETTFPFDSSQSLQMSCYIALCSGAHASEVLSVASNDNGLVANIDPPNLAPSAGALDWLWFAFGVKARTDNAVTAYPANYGSNQATNQVGSGSAGHTTALATRNLNASSDNPGVFTCVSTRAALGFTFALRPTAAAVLAANFGSFSLSGQAAALKYSHKVQAGHGSFVLSGQAATLRAARSLVAAQGSYAFSGQAASLLAARRVTADFASYSLSGQTASLIVTRLMAALHGSYLLNGQNATLSRGRTLTADHGLYAFTEQDASLFLGRLISANTGTLTLAGQQTQLLAARLLLASQGVYTLSGQTARTLRGWKAQGDHGAYSLSGQAVNLRTLRRMSAVHGLYFLSGQDAELVAPQDIGWLNVGKIRTQPGLSAHGVASLLNRMTGKIKVN